MAEGSEIAAEVRAWLLGVLERHPELSAASWAKKAGVAGSTVQRAIKPTYQFVTSSRTLAKLAAAANESTPEFRAAAEAQLVPHFLPVRYRVQAGHWIESDDYAQTWVAPPHPVAPHPSFSEWPQWLEEVVGDSIDLKIPPGGFAHVVDAIAMGYAPRDGDYVVIERKRDGGQLRERSIKQIDLKARGRVQLWPRSSNPAWSKPLDVLLGANDADIEVAIVGLVIGSYSSFA